MHSPQEIPRQSNTDPEAQNKNENKRPEIKMETKHVYAGREYRNMNREGHV